MSIFLLLFSSIANAQVHEVDEVLDTLRTNLFDYFQDPSTSVCSKEEIKDFLIFYINIPPNDVTVDISTNTAPHQFSNKPISDVLNCNQGAVLASIPTCSDGTSYGQCSSTKPQYCYSGSLLFDCSQCGCPGGSACGLNGECAASAQTAGVACSNDIDCGTSQFTGSYSCSGNFVVRDFINYTCNNPGTTNASCSSVTAPSTLSFCDPSSNEVCVAGNSSCQVQAPTCSDGTAYGACAGNTPQYCSGGSVTSNCKTCGCPASNSCEAQGECYYFASGRVPLSFAIPSTFTIVNYQTAQITNNNGMNIKLNIELVQVGLNQVTATPTVLVTDSGGFSTEYTKAQALAGIDVLGTTLTMLDFVETQVNIPPSPSPITVYRADFSIAFNP